MTAEKLYEIYSMNLQSVITPEMLATVSDRTYGIHGYNFINRLLIYIQNKYITAVKGEAAWNTVGRSIADKASTIWVLENIKKVRYFDADTMEEITSTDLSLSELSGAIRIGAIIKTEEVDGLKCIPVYNIKDTFIYDAPLYKQYCRMCKQSLKFSNILLSLARSYDIKMGRSKSESYYSPEKYTIYIAPDSLNSKISALANALFIQSGLKYDLESMPLVADFSRDEKETLIELCRVMLRESLNSLMTLNQVEASSFADLEDIEINTQERASAFVQLLYSTYELVEKLVTQIRPELSGMGEEKLRKAAELLDLLEANAMACSLHMGD